VEGSVQNFLSLDRAEMEFIDVRISFSRLFKKQPKKHHWARTQIARKLHTSPSRIAKIEKNGLF